MCKKKSKVVAMMKGQPGSNIPHRVLKTVRGKAYKFLQILPLSTIKKIVDVVDSESESRFPFMPLRIAMDPRHLFRCYQVTR